jgi:hypothetical protein
MEVEPLEKCPRMLVRFPKGKEAAPLHTYYSESPLRLHSTFLVDEREESKGKPSIWGLYG